MRFLLVLLPVFLFASVCLGNQSVLEPSVETVARCDHDCCSSDCPPLRYKCYAYVSVYDKTCDIDDENEGIRWCEKIADFWNLPFLEALCKIFPNPNQPDSYCANYGPQDYLTLVGKSKKGVFNKFHDLLGDSVYDGYFSANVCIKFDKYCKAY